MLNNGGEFVLDTDASNYAIGAVLSQIQDGDERVIAYASRTLNTSGKNYCVTRKEMFAVVYFVRHFKHYLLGREFTLRTDHGSLVWLHRFKEPDGQISRWLQQLGPYVFRIVHRSGIRHRNADAILCMSRANLPENERICTLENDGQQFDHIEKLRCLRTEVGPNCEMFAIETPETTNNDTGSGSKKGGSEKSSTRDQDDTECVRILKRGIQPNRPPRARHRKQPNELLTFENIRMHQMQDDGIRPLLQWKEDNRKNHHLMQLQPKILTAKFGMRDGNYSNCTMEFCVFDGYKMTVFN